MGKVHVGFVENHDLSSLQMRAEFARALLIVLPGSIDDGKTGQLAAQIQPQMAFGGRLAPPMFGPVQAVGDQLDDRRVDDRDGGLEPWHQAAAPSR